MSNVNLVIKFAAMLVVGFPNCAPPSVQSVERRNALGVAKNRCQNVLGVVPKTLALIAALIQTAANARNCAFVTVKAAKKAGISLRVQHARNLFVRQTIQVNAYPKSVMAGATMVRGASVGYYFVVTVRYLRRASLAVIRHVGGQG